jgi:hypothetical protein
LVAGEGSDQAAWVFRTDTGHWTNYGGRIVGAPGIAFDPSTGTTYLVATAPNGTLWSRTNTTGWTAAGGTCSEPDLALAGTTLVLGCTGTNKSVYSARFTTTSGGNPRFTSFTSLGGTVYGGPSVYVPTASSVASYTAVGNVSGSLGSNLWRRSDSSGWTAVNARCSSHPAAVSRAGNFVFNGCRDNVDGSLHLRITIPGHGNDAFDGSLGGGVQGGVGVVGAADDSSATFFIEGNDKAVWFRPAASDGTAGTWTKIGGVVLGGVRAAPLS